MLKMKPVYFEMLDFEARIPDNYFFHDEGCVLNLLRKTKNVLAMRGMPNKDEDLIKVYKDLSLFNVASGFCLGLNSILANGASLTDIYIYYRLLLDKSKEIYTRAHEEIHAISHLGLKLEVVRRFDAFDLENLDEEDFCDAIALKVLARKGVKPHPNLLIPYEQRLVSHGVKWKG